MLIVFPYFGTLCLRTDYQFYRGANKGLHVLLSRTQGGPGRTVKQKQEDISRNHVPTFIYLSVHVGDPDTQTSQPENVLMEARAMQGWRIERLRVND